MAIASANPEALIIIWTYVGNKFFNINKKCHKHVTNAPKRIGLA